MHEPWDGTERRKSPEPGFALNSWSAVLSFLSVCLMGLGGITWGLKLESRIDKCVEAQAGMRDKLETDILNIRSIIDRGVLPVTAVRLETLEARVKSLDEGVSDCLRDRGERRNR